MGAQCNVLPVKFTLGIYEIRHMHERVLYLRLGRWVGPNTPDGVGLSCTAQGGPILEI